jgi:hypothetical protein
MRSARAGFSRTAFKACPLTVINTDDARDLVAKQASPGHEPVAFYHARNLRKKRIAPEGKPSP